MGTASADAYRDLLPDRWTPARPLDSGWQRIKAGSSALLLFYNTSSRRRLREIKVLTMNNEIVTERLILRPWQESDAESLYKYARDPEIGPIAGWPPHTSVEDSLNVIRTVFSAPETYAVVLKMYGEGLHSAQMQAGEAEIGYWIGRPFWGQGLIPEAVRRLLQRCFEELGFTAVWCGYYDGNTKSRRVMDKCGFRFHHTEEGNTSPLGDIRTEHFMKITKEEWLEDKNRYGYQD